MDNHYLDVQVLLSQCKPDDHKEVVAGGGALTPVTGSRRLG